MALTHLTDFSDKLSPMLVKELRQGMRARSFTLLFLIFQCLLAAILLISGAASESDVAGSAASQIIFTMFSIAVLFIQPMRGVNALSSEITGNTIEMMALTRLSAWRIVFGKWIAIVSQSALILITIVPYVILRYFFGGMNLLGELVFLTLIFLTSMALTALMVGLSATTNKLARVVPIFGIILLARALPGLLSGTPFVAGMSFLTLSDWKSWIFIFCYVSLIAYYGWCALSHGTSAIAPSAENHSTIRRVISLALACVVAVAGLHDGFHPYGVAIFMAVILTPAVVTALTEPAIILPPICKPFLLRGLPGRIAAMFLLPGWPTGVFYTALTACLAAGGIMMAKISKSQPTSLDSEFAIGCLSAFGDILFAGLLSAAFSKQESRRFTNFTAFLVFSLVLTFGVAAFAEVNDYRNLLWLFSWNPPVWVAMLTNRHFNHDTVVATATVVDLLLLAMLLAVAARGYRDYGRVFAQTEEGMAHDANTANPVSPAP